MKNNKLNLFFTLCFVMIPLAHSYGYELRLAKEEKANIVKAVNSGTKLYTLKTTSIIYDLINNTKWAISKPIVARFFNEPTLAGQRYMETDGKVRFIVDPYYLHEVSQVTQMRPLPEKHIETNSSTLPLIPVGAPFEK